MVANPERRTAIADAALAVLGDLGGRGLTHRAVDARAAVPAGTCANYFPTRSDLLVGLAERIFVLLAPEPDRLAALADVPAAQAAPEYAGYVAERLLARPELARALLELRLEGARSRAVGEPLARFLRAGLAADVEFHERRGLPGGTSYVVLLHHLVEGIVLDAATQPLRPRDDPVATAKDAARRLLGAARPQR